MPYHVQEPAVGEGLLWGGFISSLVLHLLVLVLLFWHSGMALPDKVLPPVEMVYETADLPAHPVRAMHKAAVPVPPAPVQTQTPPAQDPLKEYVPPLSSLPVLPPRAYTVSEPADRMEKKTVQQKMPLYKEGSVSPDTKLKPELKLQNHVAQLKDSVHPVEKHVTRPLLSRTEQRHELVQVGSHSLLSTLASLRTEQPQDHPSRDVSDSQQGGDPHGGGSPEGDIRALSAADQKVIGASVRRCYQEDIAARDYAHFVAHLVVTVDASGVVRLVRFAPETAARMASDVSYRALAERARAAVLSPVCARLPIPLKLLGQTSQLHFVFRP